MSVTVFKRFCGTLLLLLLLLPALQAKLRWAPEASLNGAFELAPRIKFSIAGLTENSFQPALERYLEDRIGFRGFLIRLRNQLGYSVFRESWANHMVVGRHRVLFEREYIDAYLGTDYVGDEEVRFNTRRLRLVQDSLARHGVPLVFIIAPSKATFMPENMPTAARQQASARARRTNYDAYARALPAAGVHVLDMSRAFRRWKPTAPHPLFTTGGTHWSMYGGMRAADTLQTYLRQVLGVRPVPFQVTGTELTTSPRDTDDDITKTLNLLVVPHTEELAYPSLDFRPNPADPPAPNLLLIADSFGWTWVYNNFFSKSFSEKSHYWYYNWTIARPENPPQGPDIIKYKNRQQYLGRDVIVVMFNELNLKEFDKGFSRELFNIFCPYHPADYTRYAALIAEQRTKATWEESAQEGFEHHITEVANAILDRERVVELLGK